MLHLIYLLLFFNINPTLSLPAGVPSQECTDRRSQPPTLGWPLSEQQRQQQQQWQQPPNVAGNMPPPSRLPLEKRLPVSPIEIPEAPEAAWPDSAGSPGSPGGLGRGDKHPYIYQLPIQYPDEKGIKWQIWDTRGAGEATPGWYIQGRMKPTDPDVMIDRGSAAQGRPLARGKLHLMGGQVDIDYSNYRLPGTPDRITLEHTSLVSRKHSIVIAGRTLSWKGTRNGQFTSQDLKLVDELRGGELWAVIALDRDSAANRWGFFQISKDFNSDDSLRRDPQQPLSQEEYDSLLEQIVVSGMMMLFQELGTRRGTVGNTSAGMMAGSMAAGGGGGGVAC